jgi:hypothetical protein
MGLFTRVLPLLVVAVTGACAPPSTGVTEERPGNAAATITSSPSSPGDGTGADGSSGVGVDGQDGQDGQDGRSGRGDDADGRDGNPPTSSRGPDGSSFSATTNDVLIGPNFVDVQRVSFGSTSPGSTATRAVKVVGFGGATVLSVSLSSGSGTFRLLDNGCTAPGPSCRVTVSASPPTEGEHEGTLGISYTTAGNKPGSTEVTLTVSGEGASSERRSSEVGTTEPEEPEVPEESATESPPTTSG